MRSRGCARSVAVSPLLVNAPRSVVADAVRAIAVQGAAGLIGDDVNPRAVSRVENLRGNRVRRLRRHRDVVEMAVDHRYERDVVALEPFRGARAPATRGRERPVRMLPQVRRAKGSRGVWRPAVVVRIRAGDAPRPEMAWPAVAPLPAKPLRLVPARPAARSPSTGRCEVRRCAPHRRRGSQADRVRVFA